MRAYFRKITDYLSGDIKALQKADDTGNDVGCGPYLLTTCSGIDNLGELFFPELKAQSGAPFMAYVRNYLGGIDPIYKKNNVDKFIYVHIRCGQVHEAIVKSQVLIGKKKGRECHLKRLLIDTGAGNNKEVVFFNPRLFADDFLASLRICESDLDKQEVIDKASNFLRQRYDSHERSLTGYKPDLEEVRIDSNNFSELYQSSSTSPYFPGGTYLKDDFWKEFI